MKNLTMRARLSIAFGVLTGLILIATAMAIGMLSAANDRLPELR